MSANADLTTVETYAHKGKQLKTGFSYMGQNVKKRVYFCLFEGPYGGGAFNDQTGPILLSSNSYLYTCEIRKQSEKSKSSNPKYERQKIILGGGGVLGAPYVEPRVTKFSEQ